MRPASFGMPWNEVNAARRNLVGISRRRYSSEVVHPRCQQSASASTCLIGKNRRNFRPSPKLRARVRELHHEPRRDLSPGPLLKGRSD